jgi:DNA-binding transcriptional LysR family regulator
MDPLNPSSGSASRYAGAFMDTISSFNVFVQVAETRSFVAAGRALGVSASAIGKSITRLEERFGVRLFNRSTRSVTLTAEGMQFLERSRRILAEIEAAEAEMSQSMAAPRGRLKISLPMVGDPFLPVLAGFKKAYPDIELDLHFDDRRVDVIEEGYDAVIRAGEVPDSRLTSRLAGEFQMVLVGSPDYFKANGVPHKPKDLLQHACIQFRFANTGKLQPWPVHMEGTEDELPLPAAITCNSFEARVSFAVEGVGIAYLPDFAIRPWLEEGKLIRILEDHAQTDVYRIMWPSGKHPAPKLRAFIDYVVENLFPKAKSRRSRNTASR